MGSALTVVSNTWRRALAAYMETLPSGFYEDRHPGDEWHPVLDPIHETRHPCGCRTVFDQARWRSVALSRCAQHRPSAQVPRG